MSAAQVAPGFTFPKGRPVLLLVGANGAFSELEREFAGRVRFIRLDANSTAGRDAAKEFSVEKPPASVLADSKGRVVGKIEGTLSAAAMHSMLETLVDKSGRK